MTVSWGALSHTTFVWGQLSAVTDAQGDIDFQYVASTQAPLLVSSETDRAIPALDNPIERP
jgi:hypothetical protein